MNNQIARAFIISRMDDDQVRNLHSYELRINWLEPPCAIREYYDVCEWGEIPKERRYSIDKVIMGIFYDMKTKAESDAMRSGKYSEASIQHDADWETRKRKLDFEGCKQRGGSLKNKLKGAFSAKPTSAQYQD
jgi:hypothetical protein